MRLAHLMVVVAVLIAAVSWYTQCRAGDLAQAYNVKGMEFHRQRQYDSAETWFRAAVKENPEHKLANYNLACVLSLQLSRDHWSWRFEDGTSDDPFAQLERAILLDPSVVQKAGRDPDFMNIRLTPKFQMLIGADLKSTKLIETILVGQGEWFGERTGVWGGTDLLFFETGEVWKRVYAHEGMLHILKYERGQYSVDAGLVTMRFESGEVLEGYFDDAGDLQTGTHWPSRYFVKPPGDV